MFLEANDLIVWSMFKFILTKTLLQTGFSHALSVFVLNITLKDRSNFTTEKLLPSQQIASELLLSENLSQLHTIPIRFWTNLRYCSSLPFPSIRQDWKIKPITIKYHSPPKPSLSMYLPEENHHFLVRSQWGPQMHSLYPRNVVCWWNSYKNREGN